MSYGNPSPLHPHTYTHNSASSLSDTEHGWAHGSNTVYTVIHGLTGTSIELQPCLGISWYYLDSNVARICTNKARIYSIKQGLSRFEHDLQNLFHTIFCNGLVRLNTTLSRVTGHLQGPDLLLFFHRPKLWEFSEL